MILKYTAMLRKLCLFAIVIGLFLSCSKQHTAVEILQTAIKSIDTVHSIQFTQQMQRTNLRNGRDTIFQYRSMSFQRLKRDSIVGVKGHWNMYLEDTLHIAFEDIYDGDRLLRKNNRDSVVRVYDLTKYPGFREKYFWSHNTLFGMQYEFKRILADSSKYQIQRLDDTSIRGIPCYQIGIGLENLVSMPGFAYELEARTGIISKNRYFIDKQRFCLLGVQINHYEKSNPAEVSFLNQQYFNLSYNQALNQKQFDTSVDHLVGYEIKEMQP